VTNIRIALDNALESAPRLPRDGAITALAQLYADLVDDAVDRLGEADDEGQAANFARMAATIAKIGPRLEATLAQMGMTPGARPARPEGGAGGDPVGTALDAARLEQHTGAPAGIDYAASVDPSVTDADPGD
jgi:hypothetical protein